MCDCESTSGVTRREAIIGSLVVGSAIAAAGIAVGSQAAAAPNVPAAEVLPGLSIYPRDAWGAVLPAKGSIEVETPQFLLVHHTASSNSYSGAASVIQSTYAFQTSAAKRWNDVCYPLLPEIRTRAVAQRDAWKTTLKPARRLGVVTL